MLSIQEGMSLTNVQSDFNNEFPYLKLEFFKHRHDIHGANSRRDLLKPDGVLRSKSREAAQDMLVISGSMTVADFEQLFQDNFGLSVQVFRKSGRAWLETTFTDDWTLEKQNREGLELSALKS